MDTGRFCILSLAMLLALRAHGEDDADKIQKLREFATALENCSKNSERAMIVFQIEPMKCYEPSAAKALIRLLNSPDQGLSYYAGKALVAMGARVVPILAVEARDTNVKELREECLHALALCKPEPLQNEADERVLREVLMKFWRAGGDTEYWARAGLARFYVACMPALLSELDSAEADRQREALSVLGNVKGSAQDVAPQIERFIRSEDRKISELAMRAAARLGKVSDAGLDGVVEQLKTGGTHQRNAAVDVLIENGAASVGKLRPVLVQAKADRACRADALFVIKKLIVHAEPCIPELIEALGDPDRRVAFAAADVLSLLGAKANGAGFALLKAMSEHRASDGSIERALKAIGPLEIGELIRALDLERQHNRALLYTLKRLGEYGKKAAVAEPAVRSLLDSNDAEVHRAALETLDLIKPAKDAEF